MKKILVCGPLEFTGNLRAGDLEKLNIFSGSEVYFTHAFKVTTYPFEFSVYSYPQEGQKDEICDSVHKIIHTNVEKIGMNKLGAAKIHAECLFYTDVKSGMVEYAKQLGPDVVVTFMRQRQGIKGIFSSSFTDYMVKHTSCNVLVLKLHN